MVDFIWIWRQISVSLTFRWRFISKIGKGKLIFFKQGETVTASVYRRALKQHLKEIRRQSGSRKFTFQQDGATAHTERENIVFAEKNVPDYIEKENWPGKSCDLNPLDYAIWGIMDQQVYKDVPCFDNIDQLKAKVGQVWKGLSQRVIDKAIDQWRDRLTKVIEHDWGHIEQFF